MARRKIINISKRSPVNAEQAKNIANKERHIADAKLDYDCVIKRIADDGGVGGLRYNGPPGRVR
jgi:hypothetical protein